MEEKVVIIQCGVGSTPRTARGRRRGSLRRGTGWGGAMGQAAKCACEGAPPEAETSKLVTTGDSAIKRGELKEARDSKRHDTAGGP